MITPFIFLLFSKSGDGGWRAVGWRALWWEAVRQVWCGARVVWGETVGKGAGGGESLEESESRTVGQNTA